MSQPRDKMLGVKLSSDEMALVKAVATRANVSVAAWARDLILKTAALRIQPAISYTTTASQPETPSAESPTGGSDA
jgi:hypothetical protein